MRKLPVLLIALILVFISCLKAGAQADRPKYNKSLADSLGADDYGMKKYVLVILKTGKRENVDKQTQDSLFAGHMKNITRLADAGKLVVAGPMQKNDKTYRGIFILNVQTIEDATLLVDTDPAIHGGLLEPEFYPWYGSAALPLYLKYHPQLQKKNF